MTVLARADQVGYRGFITSSHHPIERVIFVKTEKRVGVTIVRLAGATADPRFTHQWVDVHNITYYSKITPASLNRLIITIETRKLTPTVKIGTSNIDVIYQVRRYEKI